MGHRLHSVTFSSPQSHLKYACGLKPWCFVPFVVTNKPGTSETLTVVSIEFCLCVLRVAGVRKIQPIIAASPRVFLQVLSTPLSKEIQL